jgi:hypothetical protein
LNYPGECDIHLNKEGKQICGQWGSPICPDGFRCVMNPPTPNHLTVSDTEKGVCVKIYVLPTGSKVDKAIY